MSAKDKILRRILAHKLITIVRTSDASSALNTCLILIDVGLDVLEVSLTTPSGLGVIKDVMAARPNALIGAGTVRDRASLESIAQLGVRFIVCPGFDKDLVVKANKLGLVTLPGVATASEVHHALNAGADLLKLFPAASYGAAHMKALLQPFPTAQFVPTGGVTIDNAREWLNAGAVALGVGGSLTQGAPKDIAHNAKTLFAKITA